MKKVHLTITIFLISAILLIIVLAVVASNKSKENPISNPILDKGTIIFYYGITCPHCKITEQYIIDNNIDSKVTIVRKEIYENQANAMALQQAAKQCNLPLDEIGVPFMIYNNSCYMGDENTIKLLRQVTEEN